MDKLGINIQFLVSQIINFLILFFLFSKFLYKPIVKLLEERKKKIAQTLEDSARLREELIKVEEEKKKVLSDVRKQGEAILLKQKELAEVKRKEMLEKADSEAKRVVQEAKEQIKQEEREMIKRLRRETGNLVVQTTKKILEGVDQETQHRVIDETISKIAKGS